mmetsp:Transcript_122496/g.305929  ORF Transcript_122496/g.305929 Transcript_122496/m.305929 type:complete len:146 (-) Transcript_122496:442-879(-)
MYREPRRNREGDHFLGDESGVVTGVQRIAKRGVLHDASSSESKCSTSPTDWIDEAVTNRRGRRDGVPGLLAGAEASLRIERVDRSKDAEHLASLEQGVRGDLVGEVERLGEYVLELLPPLERTAHDSLGRGVRGEAARLPSMTQF